MDKNLQEILLQLSKLLEKSEERIDKTGEIISNCVSVTNKITDEFTKQIAKVQKARDTLIAENKDLIRLVKESNMQIEMLNKRYDLLMERVFNLINKNTSENNINVK